MAFKERVDEGGGGSGGGPTPLPNPVPSRPAVTGNEEIQLLGPAELGQPIPLAYGRHLVAGKVFFQHVIQSGGDAGKTLLFVALGEGEWDAIEALFVNNQLVDHTDTNLIHFHPGLNGEAGVESAPATRNQKTCSFWPTNLPELNFPNIAYISLKLAPDFEAPSEEFFVIGIYRTLKVRIFDATGTQTSYAYSTNPAWHALDKHIRTWIAADKLNGETLSAAEKGKIDFSFFKTWADDCDFDIGSGVKRFEAHVALTQETDLMRALELDHLLGRAFTLEVNGKITPSMDKARSSLVTVTSTDFAEGSLQLGRRSLREAANRFEASFRQLDSANGAGTISTSGVTVTGTGSDFTKHFKPGEPCDLRGGAQAGEIQVVKSVASDTAMTLETAFSADQTSVAYGNPAQDFQVRTHVVEDATLQSQVGRIITAKFDLGNTTLHQADRTMTFLEKRTTDLARQASFRLLMGRADALDLLPGDVITASDDIGLDPANTRDYEILEVTIQPDGSVEVAAQEYQNIFSDSSSASQQQALALPPQSRLIYDSRQLTVTNVQTGLGSSALTAVDAGATARIDVAQHTPQFPSNHNPTYNAGNVPNLAFSTLYHVYADDPKLEGGTVPYFATTNKLTIIAAEGRYYVGAITTPADGGGGSGGDPPPCTVKGTPLLTNQGALPNDEIYRRWKAGFDIRLQGQHKFEQIVAFDWVEVPQYWVVHVEGYAPFGCSQDHVFFVHSRAGKTPCKQVEVGQFVETIKGWRRVRLCYSLPKKVQVARITLGGPSHIYYVREGVKTHNLKV